MKIKVLRQSERPTWRPRASDLTHSSGVLELSYYQNDLRARADEDASRLKERDALRRKRGAALQELCPGLWSEKEILFWARGNDSATLSIEDAADDIMIQLKAMGFGSLGSVAESKWISVFQLICDMSWMGAHSYDYQS